LSRPGALVAVLVLAASAGGSASAAGRPGGLSVWPARVLLAAGSTATINVANGGRDAETLTIGVAGFALDLRGAPRVVASSDGTHLLGVRPSRLAIAPGQVATFVVRARQAGGLRPGDHPALVLLGARRAVAGSVEVRVRIGVAVEVHVAGTALRRLSLRSLYARGRMLELAVGNGGDVAERIDRASLLIQVWRRARLLALLRPRPRELLPHTRGIVEFRIPARLRGRVRAVAVAPGRQIVARRSFSVSL
jgi:hypothetical protein